MAGAQSGSRGSEAREARELRLALVCFGGVSLAIYMHGVTKEIHRLVLASAALGRPENPFDEKDTAAVYWDLLRRIQDREVAHWTDGSRPRVLVDIISGASAGGINGVFLARALAGDHSQDELRKLWMDRGDIKQLLRGPKWIPAVLRGLWWAVRSAWRPWKVKAPLR